MAQYNENLLLGVLYLAQALSPQPDSGNEAEERAVERIDAALDEAIKAVRHHYSAFVKALDR